MPCGLTVGFSRVAERSGAASAGAGVRPARSASCQICKHNLDSLPQYPNVMRTNRIHNFCIKIKVMMGQHISHPHHSFPLNLRITR